MFGRNHVDRNRARAARCTGARRRNIVDVDIVERADSDIAAGRKRAVAYRRMCRAAVISHTDGSRPRPRGRAASVEHKRLKRRRTAGCHADSVNRLGLTIVFERSGNAHVIDDLVVDIVIGNQAAVLHTAGTRSRFGDRAAAHHGTRISRAFIDEHRQPQRERSRSHTLSDIRSDHVVALRIKHCGTGYGCLHIPHFRRRVVINEIDADRACHSRTLTGSTAHPDRFDFIGGFGFNGQRIGGKCLFDASLVAQSGTGRRFNAVDGNTHAHACVCTIGTHDSEIADRC